ncbi:ABC transporter substrate-binding protein [Ruficoccus sp. ZRK36]|uniref:ABC transporter substrate-binding protein n=1 Tax=Ruficoccus sp. ZRK36 TaxID=2866311 RepID=UPI001C738718|nr:ABC transporter substrate-binding protein [Ruficoccus sp. ZRK36]QYY34376.1 ABC transporter substrate-binding protein [Ruficoccus sp. ZRK36]
MKRYFQLLAYIFFACLLAACSKPQPHQSADSESDKLIPITVQLDWVPEPEHGGLFQAQAKGYFEEEGLKVTLRPGGANVLVLETVAAADAQIGQSSSTQVIRAAARGIPVSNIAGVFHEIPTALILHADNPISDFSQINGKTIMARPEALWIPFLKQRYDIDFKVIAQNFGIGLFLNDPAFIQEGFYIAEPYFMEKAGAKVKLLTLAEGGWHAYATLFANDKFLARQPEAAEAFVRAYVRGWRDYLEGDPTPGNALMKKMRTDGVTDEFLAYSRDMIIQHRLAADPAEGEGYGTISPKRMQQEIDTLVQLGVLKPDQVTLDQVLAESIAPTEKE